MPKSSPKPTYNADGTHVHLHNALTGGNWWCPVDAAPAMLAHPLAQWEYSDPADHSLDGLFDESTAEGEGQTGFDPSKHTVDEVNGYLAENLSAPGEIARVLELESAGKNRAGVTDPRLADDSDGA